MRLHTNGRSATRLLSAVAAGAILMAANSADAREAWRGRLHPSPKHATMPTPAQIHTPLRHHALQQGRIARTERLPGVLSGDRLSVTNVVSATTPAPEPARPTIWSGIFPLEDIPAVAGIRAAPAGAPTVYRLVNGRDFGKPHETRMHRINPGARVLTLADVEPQPAGRWRTARPLRATGMEPRVILIPRW